MSACRSAPEPKPHDTELRRENEGLQMAQPTALSGAYAGLLMSFCL